MALSTVYQAFFYLGRLPPSKKFTIPFAASRTINPIGTEPVAAVTNALRAILVDSKIPLVANSENIFCDFLSLQKLKNKIPLTFSCFRYEKRDYKMIKKPTLLS